MSKTGVTSVSVLLCENQRYVFYAFGTERTGPGFLVDNVDRNPVVAIGHLSFTIILRERPAVKGRKALQSTRRMGSTSLWP